MDHTTPEIPVGFTAIFIVFSTLLHELSEMLQVVVNNQFSDWLKPTRLPLTKRLNIFIFGGSCREAPCSWKRQDYEAPLALRLRAASKTTRVLPLSACLPLKMN